MRLFQPAPAGELSEALGYCGHIDIVRFEGAAIPGHSGLMLFIGRIGHDHEELFKAGQASNIFGRGATGALDEAWIINHRVCSDNVLDYDAMAPVVAKVISVGEAGLAAGEHGTQPGVTSVAHLVTPFWVGIAIAAVADLELEEMVVFKQHDGLDDVVNGLEAAGERHLDTPPDGGLHIVELDVEPGNAIADHAVFLI